MVQKFAGILVTFLKFISNGPASNTALLLQLLQTPFWGMNPGQVLSLKLHQPTSVLLPFPKGTSEPLVQLAIDCWAEVPASRPAMHEVIADLNGLALQLLGEEGALAMFPDMARMLSAMRQAGICKGAGI